MCRQKFCAGFGELMLDPCRNAWRLGIRRPNISTTWCLDRRAVWRAFGDFKIFHVASRSSKEYFNKSHIKFGLAMLVGASDDKQDGLFRW